MSVRVHELAKELKISSKELIAKLKAVKVSASSHMSVLTSEQVKLVKDSQVKAKTPVKSALPTREKPSGPMNQAPSIESVKKEFMIQRLGLKAAQAKTEVKKPAAPAPPVIRRPLTLPPTPRHRISVAEDKKKHKPHPGEQAPSGSGAGAAETQTAATDTGPAIGPLPASSIPITNLCIIARLPTKYY